MQLFVSLLREKRGVFLYLFLWVLIFGAAFALYGVPLGAIYYPAALCAILAAAFLGAGLYQRVKKHQDLEALQALPDNLCQLLQRYQTQDDLDYQAILALLSGRESTAAEITQRKMSDMIDYYTTWVHQIKTPIASMRLNLQNEDSPLSRKVGEDLFRIEQYVQMVLTYLRLDSESTDYLFKEYAIDSILKNSLRKFARQFIGKGIRLEYTETGKTVVTDEKWFSFVLEQVLSNALKYTAAGSISIYMEPPATLCIEDTGVGIAPEDLPRIFEKGYTGYNGRINRRASGLGLYLCQRICRNLEHGITAQSTLGKGTVIKIDLSQENYQYE